jgi:hypothetical protein
MAICHRVLRIDFAVSADVTLGELRLLARPTTASPHAHPGTGMLTMAAPSGIGGTLAAVADGGGAGIQRASSRLIVLHGCRSPTAFRTGAPELDDLRATVTGRRTLCARVSMPYGPPQTVDDRRSRAPGCRGSRGLPLRYVIGSHGVALCSAGRAEVQGPMPILPIAF